MLKTRGGANVEFCGVLDGGIVSLSWIIVLSSCNCFMATSHFSVNSYRKVTKRKPPRQSTLRIHCAPQK